MNSQKPCTNRWGPNKLAVVLTAKDRIASATYRITLSMSSMSTADKSLSLVTLARPCTSSSLLYRSFLPVCFPSSLESTFGLSVNHALTSPVLIHPVLRVALPPSVPSTHHCHHPSPLTLHSKLETFLSCKSFSSQPSVSPPGLTPRILRSVYWYFWAHPFLLLSFCSVIQFLAVGSVR